MNQVETEQNLNLTERVHSMEQKLATVSSHMLDMARINNEYRQRITELEVAGQQQQHHHQQQWQEVESNKGKFHKIKEKSYIFFTKISVPGVPSIFTTEIYLSKGFSTLLILLSVSFGFYNVAESTNDYYNYDVITNIKRVTPSTLTFPAITICTYGSYKALHYLNGEIVYSTTIYNSPARLHHFVDSIYLLPNPYETLDVSNQIDVFKIPDFNIHCLRFNGIKNVSHYNVSSTINALFVHINNSYDERISDTEYVKYYLKNEFYVFVLDNNIDSFYKSQPLILPPMKQHLIKIDKPSIERKLEEPYNQCKETKTDKHYHQVNCLETCIYRAMKDKYNCTYSGLFAIDGLDQCPGTILAYESNKFKKEFSAGCELECPVECYSEQLIIDFTATEWDQLDNNWVSRDDMGTKFEFTIPRFESLIITQIPKMNEFEFISNIGGALGLFMGLSFLNFVEVFQFIVDIITLICS